MMSSRTPVDYAGLTVEQVVRRMSPGHKDALVCLHGKSITWDGLVARVRDSLVHKTLATPSGEITDRGREAAHRIQVDRGAAWEKYL